MKLTTPQAIDIGERKQRGEYVENAEINAAFHRFIKNERERK